MGMLRESWRAVLGNGGGYGWGWHRHSEHVVLQLWSSVCGEVDGWGESWGGGCLWSVASLGCVLHVVTYIYLCENCTIEI